jgi:hypothetical protein
LRGLLFIATAVGVAGALGMHIIPQKETLWWHIPITFGEPAAGFLSRNHFAGFAALLCPAAAILCAEALSTRRWPAAVFDAACFAALSTAVVTSQSRGGFLAYAFGMVLTAVFMVSRRHPVRSVSICVLVCAALTSVALFAQGETARRLETMRRQGEDSSVRRRVAIWRGSVSAWRLHPLAGAGAEGFRTTFPAVGKIPTDTLITHAESEYAQLLVDGGTLGVGLFCWLVAGFVLAVRRALRSAPERGIVLAAVAAILIAAVHGIWDFSPHMPLYAIAIGALSGLAIVPREGSRLVDDRQDADAVALVAAENARRRGLLWMRGLGVLGILAALAIALTSGRRVDQLDHAKYLFEAESGEIVEALAHAPTHWYVWSRLGRAALYPREPERLAFAEHCFEMATTYNPYNYNTWRDLASVRMKQRDRDGARAAYDRMVALNPRAAGTISGLQ